MPVRQLQQDPLQQHYLQHAGQLLPLQLAPLQQHSWLYTLLLLVVLPLFELQQRCQQRLQRSYLHLHLLANLAGVAAVEEQTLQQLHYAYQLLLLLVVALLQHLLHPQLQQQARGGPLELELVVQELQQRLDCCVGFVQRRRQQRKHCHHHQLHVVQRSWQQQQQQQHLQRCC
jgi:hypothetical protein